MNKYKMATCSLAFSLCSFIGYAGVAPEEYNTWGYEIGFNESNSLPTTEAPNRGFWGFHKKAHEGPRYGDRRTTLTLKPRNLNAPEQNVGQLHPEKHLCEVYKIREVFTMIGDKKDKLGAWLGIKNKDKNVNMDNFDVRTSIDMTIGKFVYDVKYKNYKESDFQETMILTTNKPFIEKKSITSDNYFKHIVDNFNKLPEFKKRYGTKTGLKLGKDVELGFTKTSNYDVELQKKSIELGKSQYIWDPGVKGKTPFGEAGGMGISHTKGITSQEAYQIKTDTINMIQRQMQTNRVDKEAAMKEINAKIQRKINELKPDAIVEKTSHSLALAYNERPNGLGTIGGVTGLIQNAVNEQLKRDYTWHPTFDMYIFCEPRE